MIRRLPLALVVLVAAPALAQHEGLLQIGDGLSHTLERQRALGRLPGAFLGAKPLSAYEALAYADSALAASGEPGGIDRALLERYAGGRPGPGVADVRRVAPGLYGNGTALFAARDEGWGIEVEPLVQLSYGRARRTERGGRTPTAPVWQNTRGLRAAGHLGPHFFFESRIEENQWRHPMPEHDGDSAPRLGFTKFTDGRTYDYLVGTGVVGARVPIGRDGRFEARFGRDRNRWGFGVGTLALSNYAPAYDHLQLRTSFWRLHYTNVFARFTDARTRGPGNSRLFPRKFGALHRLALDLPGRVQVELFEQVVFAAGTGGRGGFDLAYLNPVIFYRAAEAEMGSADNALLGAGAAWVAAPGVEVYGQLLLDELTLGRITDNYWGNKWGTLLGLYLVDPGWDGHRAHGLDVRVEYARLRPYLYSHRASATAFVHTGDLLGHPAGPNAFDLTLVARYRPALRVTAGLNAALTRRGRSPEGQNVGEDPLLPYGTRTGDDGVETLQGVRQDLVLLEGYAGYELLPGLFAEATLRYESVTDAELGRDRYVAPAVALRWGLPFRSARW